MRQIYNYSINKCYPKGNLPSCKEYPTSDKCPTNTEAVGETPRCAWNQNIGGSGKCISSGVVPECSEYIKSDNPIKLRYYIQTKLKEEICNCFKEAIEENNNEKNDLHNLFYGEEHHDVKIYNEYTKMIIAK
mgnify:CR=1 FL=1